MKLENLAIAAVAAFACIAPAAASAASPAPGGIAIEIGKKLLDKAGGAVVSQVIDSAFGLGGNVGPVTLSNGAVEQIAGLMQQAVDQGWYDYYLGMVQFAVEQADDYARPGTLNDATRKVDIRIDAAREAATHLDNEDGEAARIRELPAYILVRSLEIRFLEERAAIYDFYGDAGSAASARQTRARAAQKTLDQIRRVQNAWDGLRQVDLRPAWSKKVNSYGWGCNDNDLLTACTDDVYVRCFTGTDGNDAPLEVCSATTYTCTSTIWAGLDFGRTCNSTAAADAELNTARPKQHQADFERIFGDLGVLKVRLADIAGLQDNCPIGQFDGDDCFLLTPPAGAEPYIENNALYTFRYVPPTAQGCDAFNPIWNAPQFMACMASQLACDGVGVQDGDRCFVASPEPGSAPFIYQRGMYLTTN